MTAQITAVAHHGWDAQTWTAVLALALGVVNGVGALLLVWWRRRRALFEVRFITYQRPGPSGNPWDEYRLVLVNHGPAIARDVTTRLLDGDGNDMSPEHLFSPMARRDVIKRIHPAQEFYMDVLMTLGSPWPEEATVSWRDGRLQRQAETFTLSLRPTI